MEKNLYFKKVLEKIGTEFWCNNPTEIEALSALKSGAVGITTNPCYFSVLLGLEKKFLNNIIISTLKNLGFINGNHANLDFKQAEEAAVEINKRLVTFSLNLFYPLYKKSKGIYGYVAIQGNPIKNSSADNIMKEAEDFKKLGENIIIKLPSTIEGADVLEELTARGWPTICTMSFTLSQYIMMAEAYERGSKKTKKNPVCYITMLPGILNEYLLEYAAKNKVVIAPEDIARAGIYTVKEAYKIFVNKKYRTKILAGGARNPSDWTEIQGKDVAATISLKLARSVIEKNPSIESKITEPVQMEKIKMLQEIFPDFKRAIKPGLLPPLEIRGYGPFSDFQDKFISCWQNMIGEIKEVAKVKQP